MYCEKTEFRQAVSFFSLHYFYLITRSNETKKKKKPFIPNELLDELQYWYSLVSDGKCRCINIHGDLYWILWNGIDHLFFLSIYERYERESWKRNSTWILLNLASHQRTTIYLQYDSKNETNWTRYFLDQLVDKHWLRNAYQIYYSDRSFPSNMIEKKVDDCARKYQEKIQTLQSRHVYYTSDTTIPSPLLTTIAYLNE